MATDTRQRILETTAELFRRHGYTGTGLKQIVAAANAPFGSVYHHFPGGKAQLGAETIHWSGGMYRDLFVAIFEAAPDLPTAVEHFFLGAAATLEETDYADACPIATVALEVASTDETLRAATADVFTDWIDTGTRYLAAAGLPDARARELTVVLLCAIEGAFVLCRSLRSTEPLALAGARVRAEVEAALSAA